MIFRDLMIKMILSFLIVTKNNRLRCASLHEKMGKGANGEGSARRGSGGGCGGATECYRDENELGNQGLKGEYGKGDAGKMIHRPGSHPPSAPEEGGGSPPQLHFKDTDTSSAKWPISEGMGPQGEDEMSERMRMSSKSEGSSGAYPVVYAARQHTGARDALTAFSVAGLLVPFFTVLGPLIVSSTTWVYTRWGGTALAGYIFLMGANALLMPVIYSPTFKKVIFRPLMWELLSYVRDFKLRKEVDLSPEHKYIFCWHPHGRLFYGFAVFCGLFDAIVCPELGAKEFFGGINELLLSVPFIGNMLHLTGMMSCGRKHVDMQLKRGNNVGLIVGGVEEVLEGTFDDKDVLWLSRRKGFAKVAMDSGAGLVPVFAFGENLLFQHEPTWVMSIWRSLNRFAKVGAPFPIRGPWGMPIPYRKELVVVVGAPIFADEGETVDSFHARYLDALIELHTRNVGATCQPGRKLVVV